MNRRIVILLALAACTPSPRDAADDAALPDAIEIDAPLILPDGMVITPDGPPTPPGTGDAFAELANVAPKCRDGWCWFHPKPSGLDYSKIFHTGPDNIWIAGGFTSCSTVMQWNGTTWVVHTLQPADVPGPQPQDGFINSIGGSGPNNMWILYGGTVQRWDGQTWTVMDTFGQSMAVSYNAVWVDPTGVPWITTSKGKVRRYINGAWDEISVGVNIFLGSIFGTDVNDIFIATGGAVIRFDGQSFEFVYQGPTLGSFQGVKRDVWAAGDGTLAHWDGKAFTVVPLDQPGSPIIQNVSWLDTDDVWWFGGGGFMHWDGVEISTTPLDLAASFGDDCCGGLLQATIIDGTWWLVGFDGGIYTKVTPTTIQPIIESRNLGWSMWGTSIDDMYFADPNEIRHWNGSTFTTIPTGAYNLQGVPNGGVLGGLALLGVNDRRDETTQETVHMMVHFDGLSWTQTELSRSQNNTFTGRYNGIFPTGPGEALLVGNGGRALYYHDDTFELVSTGTSADLLSVWGPSPDHLYVVGTGGTVLEWKRANPAVLTPDTTFPVLGDTADLVVTGANGVAWVTQFDGTTAWRKPPAGPWQAFDFHATAGFHGFQLVAIDATSAIIFGNDSTSTARFNGTQFNYEQVPTSGTILGAFALPDGTVFAAGLEGVIVRTP